MFLNQVNTKIQSRQNWFNLFLDFMGFSNQRIPEPMIVYYMILKRYSMTATANLLSDYYNNLIIHILYTSIMYSKFLLIILSTATVATSFAPALNAFAQAPGQGTAQSTLQNVVTEIRSRSCWNPNQSHRAPTSTFMTQAAFT